ncbi:MAG: aminopeptidase N [Gammaproteobacteria bacterium]
MAVTRNNVLLSCLVALLLGACTPETPIAPEPPEGAIVSLGIRREAQAHLTEAYARFRRTQIANPAYDLHIDFDAGSDTFRGSATLTFDVAAGNTAPVTIDFDSGTITELSVNGAGADYDYERWFITLPAAAMRTGSNTVTIAYERPFATDGAGLHKFTDPEDGNEYFYTQFEPYDANRMFPHFDQPDLKATLTLSVSAPAEWQIIANTRESAITESGDENTWKFPATPRLSSYAFALIAGPYTQWESTAGDIPLRLFARRSLAQYVAPDEWFTPTQQSFDFFQRYFEIPYPFGKYDQVIVPDFNFGGMENVAAVTYNERYVTRGDKSTLQRRNLASVIAHEMAHMWFGDLVTMQWWNGLWLNESFATYMANLALERSSSFENVWDSFYAGTKLGAYGTDQLVTTHPIELEVESTAAVLTIIDGITYGKGGSVLKQLPYFIGEENFRIGVRNYLQKHAWGNTTLDDFVGELAAASGMDLAQWQQEWLYRSGVNTIQADFTCADDGTLDSFRLLQSVPATATADKILRSQRTQIGFYRYSDGSMQMNTAIPVTYSGAVTEVTEAIGLPCPDLVLPNEGDWAYAKITLDNRSFATLNQRINDFANPTTRMMLWQSLWDSVNDLSITLPQYIDFALANIGPERDENVARLVFGHIQSAYAYFARFGGQPEQLARIEDFLFDQLQQAEAGSELQKIRYEAFVGRAHTPMALDYLQALLDGDETLAGLPIDQDRRWDLVVALNRYLHDDYDARLQAEQARDASDQGVNMAYAARAARPQAEAKAGWLAALLDGTGSYKLATLRSVLGVLFPAEQLALLEPHRERILAAVPTLNGSASPEFVDAVSGALSPATCTPDSVARLAQANEDFASLQPLIVKAYLVHHQNDALCVDMKALLQ